MSVCVGPVYAKEDFAGFFRRSLALGIDAGFLFLLILTSAIIWSSVSPDQWNYGEGSADLVFYVTIFSLLYLIGLRMTDSGTLGYRLAGIRYAFMFSSRPTLMNRLHRVTLSIYLFWLLWLLDYFWILCDSRKQTWHDKVAGFYVIRKGAVPQGTQQIVRRLVNFLMRPITVWEPMSENLVASLESPDYESHASA